MPWPSAPHASACRPRIIQDDWLGAYGKIDGIGKPLDRISMRIGKGNPLSGSAAEGVPNYDKLATDFLTFFRELIVHMKPHPCRHVDPTGMRDGWRGARAYSHPVGRFPRHEDARCGQCRSCSEGREEERGGLTCIEFVFTAGAGKA
jgi:hypothetical protein